MVFGWENSIIFAEKTKKMINIDEIIKKAMLEKNEPLLSIMRLVKAEMLKKQTEPNRKSKELTEEEVNKILFKMESELTESLKIFSGAGRDGLAQEVKGQLEALSPYIPKKASEEEIKTATSSAISKYLEEMGGDYKVSMSDMRNIMSIVKEYYPMADGKVVSMTLKNYISKQN